MLPEAMSYQEICARFRWKIPEKFNIGVDVCDRWAEAEPARLAIRHIETGCVTELTFGDLRRLSSQLANLLASRGIVAGDRVAILLPQHPATAFGHIAVYKLGAIAVPLFTLFGTEALQYRLRNSGARAVITNAAGGSKIAEIRSSLPDLQFVFSIEGGSEGCCDLNSEMDEQLSEFEPAGTGADDPALIIYTSGTTGQPKGALHAHRVLLGHLPGVEMSHNFLPQVGDLFWTPADWAWIGGLLDGLLPSLHHGIPVVARRFEKFSGEGAFDLIQAQNIRNVFIPPTALKIMRAVPDAESRWQLNLRSVASGGETLGAELLDWGRRVLGVTINEFYGQTECNMVVSSCAAVMEARPGFMGRPVPGHDVAVIDRHGTREATGKVGAIAIRGPDPVMFLGYWNDPAASAAKFCGDWLVTGDMGVVDEGGYIRFLARDDDVITSAGYRIGPGEMEDCLLGHPAVQMAGVVGKSDELRTEIVKAYIVLKEGFVPTSGLAKDIQEHVKMRLAAHEYPREVEFVAALPMTTTGKVIRRELRQRAAGGFCFVEEN